MTPMSSNGPEGAQAPPTLPLFYRSIVPLHGVAHVGLRYRARPGDRVFAVRATSIPLVADEFAQAQACYPIVFSVGKAPMPVALVGPPDGGNRFVEADGRWREGAYIPGWVRRYPFCLAQVAPERDEPGLCFDAESDLFAEGGAGEPLFGVDGPTAFTQSTLQFCGEYEQATARTHAFVARLRALGLLVETAVQARDRLGRDGQPIAFGGFQVVSEEKLKALDAETCRDLLASGALGLIHAHLFSLARIGDVLTDRPVPDWVAQLGGSLLM